MGLSMGFNAIHIDSAPGAMVEQVLSRIESGELTPGTCLPSQRALARMFQVGLGTVREAIKILTVMGHLEVIRGKGSFVREVAPIAPAGRKEIQTDATAPTTHAPLHTTIEAALQAVSLADLLQTREIVECGAARLAAQHVTAAGIERLKKLSAGMTTTPETIDQYYENDYDFHLAVAEATNNRALMKMVRLLMERVHHCLDFMNHCLGICLPLNMERCVQTAREVIDRIVAGEAEAAFSSMGTHLNVVRFQLHKSFIVQEHNNNNETPAWGAGVPGPKAVNVKRHHP